MAVVPVVVVPVVVVPVVVNLGSDPVAVSLGSVLAEIVLPSVPPPNQRPSSEGCTKKHNPAVATW